MQVLLKTLSWNKYLQTLTSSLENNAWRLVWQSYEYQSTDFLFVPPDLGFYMAINSYWKSKRFHNANEAVIEKNFQSASEKCWNFFYNESSVVETLVKYYNITVQEHIDFGFLSIWPKFGKHIFSSKNLSDSFSSKSCNWETIAV